MRFTKVSVPRATVRQTFNTSASTGVTPPATAAAPGTTLARSAFVSGRASSPASPGTPFKSSFELGTAASAADALAVNNLRTSFGEHFADSSNARFFRAAGRINLIGEHTDYNDGYVLPAAIQLNVQGAFRARSGSAPGAGKIVVHSKQFDEPVSFSLDAIPDLPKGDWRRYVASVVKVYKAFAAEKKLPLHGIEGVIDSTIPVGSGLSSSAALELLLLQAMSQLSGHTIPAKDIARLAQKAEWDYGTKSGILDQFAISNGKKDVVSFIDTRSLEARPLKIDLKDHQLLIGFTKERALGSEFNRRTEETAAAAAAFRKIIGPKIKSLRDVTPAMFEKHKAQLDQAALNPNGWPLKDRAEHVIYENGRVLKAVDALEKGEIARFGELMLETHVSLRDKYDVSSPELNAMVDSALEYGAATGQPVWGRMMGGGFGGPSLLLIPKARAAEAKAEIAARYTAKTGLAGRFWDVEIEDGLRELQPPDSKP